MMPSKELTGEWRKVFEPLLNLLIPPFTKSEIAYAQGLVDGDQKKETPPPSRSDSSPHGPRTYTARETTVDVGKPEKSDPRGVPGAQHDEPVKSALELNGKTVICKIGRAFIDKKLEIRSSSYKPDDRGCVLLKSDPESAGGSIVSFIDHREIDDLIYALLRARNHSFPKAPRFKH